MHIKKPICKTDLRKNIIKKAIFDRELLLCKKLSAKNNSRCNWEICAKCGALPLLYKLHKGILLEGQKDIAKTKKKILNICRRASTFPQP